VFLIEVMIRKGGLKAMNNTHIRHKLDMHIDHANNVKDIVGPRRVNSI
jgi:hypothetical protein